VAGDRCISPSYAEYQAYVAPHPGRPAQVSVMTSMLNSADPPNHGTNAYVGYGPWAHRAFQ
jgi:hypothetical protein